MVEVWQLFVWLLDVQKYGYAHYPEARGSKAREIQQFASLKVRLFDAEVYKQQ